MTRSIATRAILLSTIVLVVLAAVSALGLAHPKAPVPAMRALLPNITLPTVVVAGVVDGINPCAFTVLLLFITALLAAAQVGDVKSIAPVRGRIIGMGSIYILAIFLTYLALGVGLLAASDIFVRGHVSARIGALVSIGLGLWMMKDFFLPGFGPRLSAPARVATLARDSARRMTVPALVVGGFLIGLCTVPCSGAIYLAILSLLAAQSSALAGYGYLLLYNVMFILPLVGILIVASARPTLNRLAHWNLRHKEYVRLIMGAGVVIMGLLILATV